jgi:hypothetical protein
MTTTAALLFVSASALMALPIGSLQALSVSESEAPRLTSSESCKECHEEIHKSWKNDMHALSLDDPVFKSAYLEAYLNTKGNAKFNCLKCHAPMTWINNDFDLEKEITREGVTCDFCHSVKDVNLADTRAPYKFEKSGIKRGPLSNVSSPAHETAPSPLFKSSEFCAGCHEYTNEKGVTILGTYSEWKGSSYAAQGQPCQHCHMPLVAGNVVSSKTKSSGLKQVNLHAISASHSVEQLRRAVKVEIGEIKQDEDFIEVRVRVTNTGSGHKVPTGIPKRQLLLIVDVKTPTEYLTQQKIYTRILKDERGDEVKKECEVFLTAASDYFDNRIKPGETRVENFAFMRPKNRKITVSARAEYLYETTVLHGTEMRVQMSEDSRQLK